MRERTSHLPLRQPFDFFATMLIPLLDAGEIRIGAVATGQVLLVEAAFLLTRLPFASWMSAERPQLARLPLAGAASEPYLVTAEHIVSHWLTHPGTRR